MIGYDPKFAAVAARFTQERERVGLSPRMMCVAADVSMSRLANWETAQAAPDAMGLAALDEFGGDVLFVVTGRRGERQPARTTIVPEPPALPAPDTTAILIARQASAA